MLSWIVGFEFQIKFKFNRPPVLCLAPLERGRMLFWALKHTAAPRGPALGTGCRALSQVQNRHGLGVSRAGKLESKAH